MALTLGMVTTDTTDARALASWWAEQTGAEVHDLYDGGFVMLTGGTLPVRLAFQQVDELHPFVAEAGVGGGAFAQGDEVGLHHGVAVQGVTQKLIAVSRLAAAAFDRDAGVRGHVGNVPTLLELLEEDGDRHVKGLGERLQRMERGADAAVLDFREHAGRQSCLAREFHDGHVVLLAQTAHLDADGFLEIAVTDARCARAGRELGFLGASLSFLHYPLQ